MEADPLQRDAIGCHPKTIERCISFPVESTFNAKFSLSLMLEASEFWQKNGVSNYSQDRYICHRFWHSCPGLLSEWSLSIHITSVPPTAVGEMEGIPPLGSKQFLFFIKNQVTNKHKLLTGHISIIDNVVLFNH